VILDHRYGKAFDDMGCPTDFYASICTSMASQGV